MPYDVVENLCFPISLILFIGILLICCQQFINAWSFLEIKNVKAMLQSIVLPLLEIKSLHGSSLALYGDLDLFSRIGSAGLKLVGFVSL